MSQTTQIEAMLGRIFDDARQGLRNELTPEEYERRRGEFIFHLTDSADDLQRLADFLWSPTTPDDEAATTALVGILYHIIPHLNTAGRLLLDEIEDPFG